MESLKLLQQIEEQTRESLKEEKNRVQFLFGRNTFGYSAFELVFCFHQNDYQAAYHQSAEKALSYYRDLSERERDIFFFEELTKEMNENDFYEKIGNEEIGIVVSDTERMRNIFSYIQEMDLNSESREFIQNCYLHRDSYAEEITKYLNSAITIIKQHQDELMGVANQWEAYWKDTIDADKFFVKCNQVVTNTLVEEKEIVVLPSFIQCAVVWISIENPILPNSNRLLSVCRMGVIILDDFNMQSKVKEEYQMEENQKKLKLLADKSKFDILLFIKEQPAYGSEIAKHFGLTTATVSHHMSLLLEEQLISVEQRNKKIYYSINQSVLQNLFDQCKDIFN
jgi:DNA-binding transcriptional ArsR family regulator